MIVGSIKENTALEKRVSVTPESAKNLIGLGLKVFVEKDYAFHLGIQEIELSFVPEAHKTHVLIELDRAFRGDGYVDLTIEHDHVNLSQLCDQLERLFA